MNVCRSPCLPIFSTAKVLKKIVENTFYFINLMKCGVGNFKP